MGRLFIYIGEVETKNMRGCWFMSGEDGATPNYSICKNTTTKIRVNEWEKLGWGFRGID